MRIVGDPERYGERLLDESADVERRLEWDRDSHFQGEEEETVAFVVTLDSINFGSGYFPVLVKRPGLSGYFTIATSLKERFERNGPWSARELQRITARELAELFGQPQGNRAREELMEHYCRALRDLGSFLEERYRGSFLELLDAARGSAERLAGTLTAMPYFRDVALHLGARVPLYKRAQITPSDLALALAGRSRGEFHDLDRLTIFADNLVPHVLRLDGLLEYEPDLAARLERGELLEPGSPEEVEIRAVALHAVERMVTALGRSARPVTARRLDLLLWNRGQAARYRGGSKHRSRTVFY